MLEKELHDIIDLEIKPFYVYITFQYKVAKDRTLLMFGKESYPREGETGLLSHLQCK